ncbi:MAG: 30S ribosomal protein S6 [Planctomycetes bacterium]|nr:30S ribosomal protein S6 [Planctomycetota bacterium]
MNFYEGMFIVDPTGLGKEEGTPEDVVKSLLDRRQAEIVHSERWAERKFSYDIKGKKKGIYVLTFFRTSAGEIRELVHDCELSDKVIRVLVLRDQDGELERAMQERKEALLARSSAQAEGESAPSAGEGGSAPAGASEGEGAADEEKRKPAPRPPRRTEVPEDDGGEEAEEASGDDADDSGDSGDSEDSDDGEPSGEDEKTEETD